MKVGENIEMPETVTAKMSDGTTKDVPVTWNPRMIDSSTPGEKTAEGTVKGTTKTVTFRVKVEQVGVDKGIAYIKLFKDSTSGKNKIDFDNISNFYLVNKETGAKYTIGKSPWNNQSAFEMKDIPVGEYTIHFDTLPEMSIDKVLLGGAYNETEYNAETNPFVITKGEKSYADIVLKSTITLKEIKPLDDLKVSKDISLKDFEASLPKQTIIVDSLNREHKVDLSWDVRPFVFDSWVKPGKYTLYSEFFDLPVIVSNTGERLEVELNITFE